MQEVQETPLIGLLLGRLAKSKEVDGIVVAIPESSENDALEHYIRGLGVDVARGDEFDVLARFVSAASRYEPSTIVRITGDCPLVDAELVDQAIAAFRQANVDYLSNTDPPTFPDGIDVEVFSYDALLSANSVATSHFDREHVTPLLRTSARFRRANLTASSDESEHRWTVDDATDLGLVRGVFEHFAPRSDFGWGEILEFLQSDDGLRLIPADRATRNEGESMNSGQKLWQRARKVIPGGNMLLSKRPEMFLPEQWPAYFESAQGCDVVDLDGNEYIDMSLMGIGTNTLGYGHPEVDDAVRTVIDRGNMSTLNCPEEVYLAERLVGMHPWADSARFARTGGEANAIAIRIARAASGKDGLAVCGYHGWHDWYLAANLGDEEMLAGHLLPGLEPNGVPENLRGSVSTFTYGDLDGLRAVIDENEIGVIKMEVARTLEPDLEFLQGARDLATANDIVLIFDECTSGFRQAFGGLHLTLGVEPDMAVFGKALGNGYAITAVIGRGAVMDAAQSTFISSTFWTERIGPVAALATLDVMEREHSWEKITTAGELLKQRWAQLADRHGLEISITGLPALPAFSLGGPNAAAYKTLITQQMLKSGYLAGTATYLCTAHTHEVLEQYLLALDPIFATIRSCEDGRSILALLDGPVCHSGFSRLN
jgi:glutamate-1-semialdehyde 2,1-aminomutase